MNHNIEFADRVTSCRPDLREQLITVEAAEVLEIFKGFINDAVECGCAAGAFRVLLAATESAANRVLAQQTQGVVQ